MGWKGPKRSSSSSLLRGVCSICAKLMTQLSRNFQERKSRVEILIQHTSWVTNNFQQMIATSFLADLSSKRNQRIMLYQSQSFCGLYHPWRLKELKLFNSSYLKLPSLFIKTRAAQICKLWCLHQYFLGKILRSFTSYHASPTLLAINSFYCLIFAKYQQCSAPAGKGMKRNSLSQRDCHLDTQCTDKGESNGKQRMSRVIE